MNEINNNIITTFPVEFGGAALLTSQCASAGVGRPDHPVTTPTTNASSCYHGWLGSGGRGGGG